MSHLKRSWAPRGRTPRARTSLDHRQRINALGAVVLTPRGHQVRLHCTLRRCNLASQQVIAFLAKVLQCERGPLMVVWDQAPIHGRRKLEAVVAQHPRLHIVEFPSYAPELNPTEFVWALVHDAVANTAIADMALLDRKLRRELRRISRSPRLLRGCIEGSGLRFDAREKRH